MQTNKMLIGIALGLTILYSCSSFSEEQEYRSVKHTLAGSSAAKYEIVWETLDIRTYDNRNNSMIITAPDKVLLEGLLDKDSQSYLFALNIFDGVEIWRRQIASSPAQLLVSDSILYRGTGGAGHLQAYDIDRGQLLWDTALPGAHSVVNLYSYNNNLFANTNDSASFILNKKGELLESKTLVKTILFETNSVLFLGTSSMIEAIDKSSGVTRWHIDFDNSFVYSPIFDKDSIYLRAGGIPDNTIYSIDQSSGKLNWKLNTNALSNLSIVNSKLYYLTASSSLIVLDSKLGKEIEKIEFSPSFAIDEYIGRYYIAEDPVTGIIVISFGDNNQILALRSKSN
jgi:outer membrane protein assembly factor BamB